MKNKLRRGPNPEAEAADEIETLYQEFLRAFYEDEDRERARDVAVRLEVALQNRPEFAGSIRAEEIRSLLAELNGDYAEAIRRRESEIRKILELHSLAANKPSWKSVFRQYDYGDLSDRLDLLAALYADQGDLDRAVDVLRESRRLCESHGIPFDGQDLLDEYEQAQNTPD
jgi:hypothetical protein